MSKGNFVIENVACVDVEQKTDDWKCQGTDNVL